MGTREITPDLKAKNHRDLIVWKKRIELAGEIYRITKRFPDEERFGLVSQMRRAAISIPSNIAEGQARHTTGEFVKFISSPNHNKAASLLDEPRRMLNSPRRKLTSPH